MGNLAIQHRYEDDADLAVISERIERSAWRDLVEAAPAWLRTTSGAIAEERDGVLMLAAPGLPHLLFNRVIGLGGQTIATEKQIQEYIERFRQLGVSSYFIHSSPYARPARLGRQLQLHGLHAYRRSWVKLLCPVAPSRGCASSVVVRKADLCDAAAIASIVGQGFAMPQRGAEFFSALIGRRQWSILIAELNGEAIATAGLYVDADTAYLAFAATRAEWRRHGAQQALIAARMNLASEADCRWIVSETGFPLAADEPSPSYQNMLRAGFRPVSIRDNYAPLGTVWESDATLE